MGLFMDANGIPIALNINPGNTNESKTMIPLEKKILEEFELDFKNIVVCTDAAMCTDDIKKFNVKDGRGFVITQSIKKLNHDLKNWTLDPEGWRIVGNLKNIYNLKEIEQDENLKNMCHTTKKGTTALDIVLTLKKIGFKAQGFKTSLDKLNKTL